MRHMKKAVVGGALALFSLGTLAACGDSGSNSGSGAFNSKDTEVVVHTGAGGGSDIFAREFVKVAREQKFIDSNWPVRNVTQGDGIGAMSELLSKKGNDNLIAFITPTWVVTPLTVKGSSVNVSQLQPVCRIVNEPAVMAVRADSKYNDVKAFIDDAKSHPNTLVQTGGSVTASDSLIGKSLQNTTGTQWKFLSFEDTGARIASLIRGDAQVMIGSESDFGEQVRAGKLKVIGSLSDERVKLFPDAKSLSEVGINATDLPQQFRGIVAPPGISSKALDYYQNACKQLVDSDAWTKYVDDNGLVKDYANAADFKKFLDEQNSSLGEIAKQLGLAK